MFIGTDKKLINCRSLSTHYIYIIHTWLEHVDILSKQNFDKISVDAYMSSELVLKIFNIILF